MGILIDETTRVVVQGITGREGRRRTELMTGYGTNVVAGVTPGKHGETVAGISVFDTVKEAAESMGPLDAAVVFVPAPFVADAAHEAMDAEVDMLTLVPDHVPVHDAMGIVDRAAETGTTVVGPNTLGVCTVGEAVVGMMGGTAANLAGWFDDGQVGITSRSGGMTTATGYYLSRRDYGFSTILHVGGDSVIGLQHPDVVRRFDADSATEAIVLIGEIGTSQEERVAELVDTGEVTTPIVAYIGGRAAESGTRYSHAGAIVERGEGSYQSKVRALRAAGVQVADRFEEVPELTERALEAA